MEIITTAELASYLRDESVTDQSSGLLVDLANGLVSDVIGALDPLPTRVRTITFECAGRAFRNPEGHAAEGVDDYNYRLPKTTQEAGVYLTPSELAELRAATAAPSGVFTVDLGTLP